MAQSKNTPAPKTAAELRALIFEGDPTGIDWEQVETRWGNLWVRELTQGERNEAVVAARDEDGNLDGSAMVAAYIAAGTYVERDGEKLFSLDDVPFILKAPARDTDRLGNTILRLSGLSGNDVKAAIDKAGKGSPSTGNGDSSSR